MKDLIKQYLDQGLSRRQLVSGLSALGMSSMAAKAKAERRDVILDPAPDLGLVTQIFSAEFLFEIGFLRFDDAFLQCRRKPGGEKKNPHGIDDAADADIEQDHADI